MVKYLLGIWLAACCCACSHKSKQEQPDGETIIRAYLDSVKRFYVQSKWDSKYIYQVSEKEIDALIPYLAEGFHARRMDKLSDEEFYKRMRLFFGFEDGTSTVCSLVEHPNYYACCDTDKIYIVKNHNFIIRLTDHQVRESLGALRFLEEEGGLDLGFIAMESEDGHFRVEPSESLVHLNEYILFGRKESRDWLLANEEWFFVRFAFRNGYDKDDRVSLGILERAKWVANHPEYLPNLFAKKHTNGRLQIREGLLNCVYTETSPGFTDYLDLLEIYGRYIRDRLGNEDDEEYTREDKLKILAYVLYYSAKTRYYKMNDSDEGPLFNRQDEKTAGLWGYITDNDYLGLPEFSDLLGRMSDGMLTSPSCEGYNMTDDEIEIE